MKKNNFTEEQLSVLKAIEKEPLTSFEILNKVDNITLILSLYNVIDELKNMGAIKSFTKEDIIYHYAA